MISSMVSLLQVVKAHLARKASKREPKIKRKDSDRRRNRCQLM